MTTLRGNFEAICSYPPDDWYDFYWRDGGRDLIKDYDRGIVVASMDEMRDYWLSYQKEWHRAHDHPTR